MADARLDPFTGRWVILAPGRAQRPDTIAQHVRREEDATPRDRGDCPFCPGNEHLTPPEITRTGPGAAGAPGWRTRVFPNRYPIVDGPRTTPDPGGDRLRVGGAASGAHEVLVLSPDHRRSLADLDSDQVVEVLTVMRDRARFHATTGRTFTQVIVNHGVEGGASLSHPHAQIIASDLEPPAVLDEAARIATADGCLVCAELERHRDDPALVVGATEADVWCPWWSGTAFEMVVAPRLHRPRFEDADEELSTWASCCGTGSPGSTGLSATRRTTSPSTRSPPSSRPTTTGTSTSGRGSSARRASSEARVCWSTSSTPSAPRRCFANHERRGMRRRDQDAPQGGSSPLPAGSVAPSDVRRSSVQSIQAVPVLVT
jgi:UDPglucose--hexose-1-phosphate uridylyltransferase